MRRYINQRNKLQPKKYSGISKQMLVKQNGSFSDIRQMVVKMTTVVNYANILQAGFFFLLQKTTQIVSTGKLGITLLYEKGVCKMFVKLIPVLHFFFSNSNKRKKSLSSSLRFRLSYLTFLFRNHFQPFSRIRKISIK